MKVLDYGSVELVDFMGGDQRVDQAAGVSLARFHRARDTEAVDKIIRYMMKHRHGTPFEHSTFTFYVKAPIFVERQWVRHRIGSFNQISGRYTKLPDECYNPRELRGKHPENRQSSVLLQLDPDEHDAVRHAIRRHYRASRVLYEKLTERGVADELARIVLPQGQYTEFVWTVNARSLMNFLSLRLHEDAQWEIRKYAQAIMFLFKEKMPLTAGAFESNGRVAP